MNKLSLLYGILILSAILMTSNCSNEQKKDDNLNSEITNVNETDPELEKLHKTSSQHEQISCKPEDCIEIKYTDYSELDSKIYDLLNENAGKVLIKTKLYNLKLENDKLAPTIEYLREILKRDGRVSVEPYYIGQRGEGSFVPGIPFVKDIGLLGWDIYSRLRNTIKFRNTNNYNAKVLFQPKYHTIMMIYFVHKNYGDVCNTIYSKCKEIEYIDDDTFDLSLSTALKETQGTDQPVKINFRQSAANLPNSTLDLENIKKLNKSSRLYKWLVITKKTEKKTVTRERFLGVEAALTVLDYSLKLYDAIQQYKVYSPAFNTRAEVVYSGNEKGGEIKSVVFYHEKEFEK